MTYNWSINTEVFADIMPAPHVNSLRHSVMSKYLYTSQLSKGKMRTYKELHIVAIKCETLSLAEHPKSCPYVFCVNCKATACSTARVIENDERSHLREGPWHVTLQTFSTVVRGN